MQFYKGKKDVLKGLDNDSEKYGTISGEFSKLLDVKNLSFLFGAGCSSLKNKEGKELGISTMVPLANDFYNDLSEDNKTFLSSIHIAYEDEPYSKNLEAFFEAILNYRNYLSQIININDANLNENLEKVNTIIGLLKTFILKACTQPFEDGETSVLELYKKFYRKLIFRDRNLPKPNIFTTNYDVFSEKSMDALNVHYSNGFSGVIDRYFNPSIFDYAFSESMDVSENKWQIIDHFVYLYKLDGSINWIWSESEGQLFNIKELQDVSFSTLSKLENIMIYPSPAKQNTSLSSPYTDLFREFKFKLSKANSVLIVAGYSFGDEHINNIIYQSLAKPSFRLVVLGRPDAFQHLLSLDDPRIWIVGGDDDDGKAIHYFDPFVNKLMPELSEREIEDSVDSAIKNLVKKNVG
ncbi:MAG: SIR2 family protein [Crocinitomicaceae bacterium]|nr:SIR2 family protein [Crocinitomicaceae bacterium]